jgi:uncharacterized membrane protein
MQALVPDWPLAYWMAAQGAVLMFLPSSSSIVWPWIILNAAGAAARAAAAPQRRPAAASGHA